jgi:hypothetical protein
MLARLKKSFYWFRNTLSGVCSSLITTEASFTLSPYIPPEYQQTHDLKRPHARLRGERVYSVFYDSGTRTLEVRYSDGDLRWYADVSERAYEALLCADRPDEALTREVFLQPRRKRSPCSRIAEEWRQ